MWIPPTKWDKEKLAKAIALCRRTKTVRHYLNPKQREFYDLLKTPGINHAGLFCSRKVGKTFLTVLDAVEFGWNNPDSIIRYVLPELKQAREVVLPIVNEFRSFLPPEMMPHVKLSELKLILPNGAVIALGGAKKENAESNRGPIAHRIYRDECASWEEEPHYSYITKSILLPQMTTTGGMLIDMTTPSKSPTHPWIQEDYVKLRQQGHLVSFDIDENPLLTLDQIEAIVERYGGRDSPDFRREYKLELITDQSLVVVPEFKNERHVIKSSQYFNEDPARQNWLLGCISADYGITDNTGILSAVYVASENQVVITAEKMFNQEPVSVLADEIDMAKNAIRERFHIPKDNIKVTVDCFEQAGITLRRDFNTVYQRPVKRKLVDNVGYLRLQINEGRVLIDESCVNLIRQLTEGMWKESTAKEDTRDFERTSTHGHLDLLHALVYLVRMVPWGRMPQDTYTGMTLRGG